MTSAVRQPGLQTQYVYNQILMFKAVVSQQYFKGLVIRLATYSLNLTGKGYNC